MSCVALKDTSISLNLTSLCSITPLNLIKSLTICMSSLHCLESTNINVCPWASNVLLILHNKLWNKSSVDWTMWKCILMTLAFLGKHGKTSSCCTIKFFLD
ncbi:hypothetical protein ACHAXS_000543 [Conticribra weissflogii]